MSIQPISAEEAVRLIPDGATLATSGILGAQHPEALTAELGRRYLSNGSPNGLTLVNCAAQGDGAYRGLNHLAHEGLLKRVIAGHWGLMPKVAKLAIDNCIEAYNLPQGVLCQLLRDIAAGRPGCITHVGLNTFIDPINQGGRLNASTTEDLVERIKIDDKTWLRYKPFPINLGLIRATETDLNGNLSVCEEAVSGEILPIAQCVRNHAGIVIAQVKRVRETPIPPHHVAVPGHLVDHIVIADAADHTTTLGHANDSSLYNYSKSAPPPPLPSDDITRQVIAHRACDELRSGQVANLGIGLPEEIAVQAARRSLLDSITLTIESGPIGGIPLGGLDFGASRNPEAIIDAPAQFDFYDGGGLDFSALGAAEIDAFGNVNVSNFGGRLAGVGGFVNISQNAKRLVFCGTFTTGGLRTGIEGGNLYIEQEGSIRKFVQRAGQVSFSAEQALMKEQDVIYVTERAVFRLIDSGLQLIEIAPGIDVQKQILDLMDFTPKIEETLEFKLPEIQ